MRILLHGLNYAPEELGIGKYSGEMVQFLVEQGHEVTVVTTPPYYPQWKIAKGYRGWAYSFEARGKRREARGDRQHKALHHAELAGPMSPDPSPPTPLPEYRARGEEILKARGDRPEARGDFQTSNFPLQTSKHSRLSPPASSLLVIRCPLWVPGEVTGLKRIIHLASYGLSSIPPMLWKSLTWRPDVVMTVEPAAFCMPTTWLAAKLSGGKAWLHVQDFEVDAAFELGILKNNLLKRIVLGLEGWLMRRFDRVSSISRNMVRRLDQKGVAPERARLFPNWVDCQAMRPLENVDELRIQFGLPLDKTIALYAGNIGAKQGLELIIDAAKRQPADSPLLFVICGAGAHVEAIRAAAVGLENVLMMPPQPFEVFNELMNCADIHLLPQRGDAADLVMPSKLTGMLATGRAIVACASPGTQIAEVVEGCGIVVPPGDVAAFAGAIEALSDDPQRCLEYGQAARRYAVEHLSREAILGRFMNELQRLVGEPFAIAAERPTADDSPETIPSPIPAPHFQSEKVGNTQEASRK